MDNDLFTVRCARCGKIEYTIKGNPQVRDWEFINRRLVCSECVKKIKKPIAK